LVEEQELQPELIELIAPSALFENELKRDSARLAVVPHFEQGAILSASFMERSNSNLFLHLGHEYSYIGILNLYSNIISW
ncbi:MAG: hypothetical protein NTV30_01590, partial [Chloroflexi bacterium]|nr:hypothetical protein [Chloroflexota bacterium]